MTKFTNLGLLLLCTLSFAASCIAMRAQQISPVIQEFNKKARGVIQVTNGGDAPKFVSCQAQGFTPDEQGASIAHPIEPSLNVHITSERMELAPNAGRQISFEATPTSLPAWFLLTCRFVPVERGQGVTLAMVMSALVIIHGADLDIRDVTLSAKHIGSKVEVEVVNNGAGMARVETGEVTGHRKQEDLTSFMLYPHQHRLVEAEWTGTTPADTVKIQIGKKHLQAPVN